MRSHLRLGLAAFVLAALGCGGGGGGSGPAEPAPLFVEGPGLAYLPMFPDEMLVGRFDFDGLLDIALVSSGAGNGLDPSLGVHTGDPAIGILRGRGEGRLELLGPVAPAAPENLIDRDAAFAGHFNPDGNLDVVVLSRDGIGFETLASVWFGKGNATLDPAPAAPVGLGRRIVRAALADANGDYFDDLAVASDDEKVAFLVCDGDGGFTSGGWFDVAGAVGDDVASLAAADMNGDGDTDLVVAQNSGYITFRYGDGLGGLPHQILFADFDAGGSQPTILVADFVEGPDGYPDLAVHLSGASPRVDLYKNNNTGYMAFPVVQSIPVYTEACFQLEAVSYDFVAPLRLVLLGINFTDNVFTLELLRLGSAGTFVAELLPRTPGAVSLRLAVADLDMDGDDDLLLFGYSLDPASGGSPEPSLRTLLSSGR